MVTAMYAVPAVLALVAVFVATAPGIVGVASPLADDDGPVWTCVSTANASASASSFCKSEAPPSPGVCVDDGDFDDNQRDETSYKKQQNQCATAKDRAHTCPNQPALCRRDVFNQSTWCGGHDQACDPNGKDRCLAYCYSDCFPCNTKANCDLLVSFGVAAPAGAPCFSLEQATGWRADRSGAVATTSAGGAAVGGGGRTNVAGGLAWIQAKLARHIERLTV